MNSNIVSLYRIKHLHSLWGFHTVSSHGEVNFVYEEQEMTVTIPQGYNVGQQAWFSKRERKKENSVQAANKLQKKHSHQS